MAPFCFFNTLASLSNRELTVTCEREASLNLVVDQNKVGGTTCAWPQ